MRARCFAPARVRFFGPVRGVALAPWDQATAHGLEVRVGRAQQAARDRASGRARPGRLRELLCTAVLLRIMRGAWPSVLLLPSQPAALRLRYLRRCCSAAALLLQGLPGRLLRVPGALRARRRLPAPHTARSRIVRGVLAARDLAGALAAPAEQEPGRGDRKMREAFFAVFREPAMVG